MTTSAELASARMASSINPWIALDSFRPFAGRRIAKLLRVETSKSDGKVISLDQYVERMKEDQRYIYFLSGDSREEIEKSPLIERLLAKDFEVIYFTEPVDEILIQHLDEYNEVRESALVQCT